MTFTSFVGSCLLSTSPREQLMGLGGSAIDCTEIGMKRAGTSCIRNMLSKRWSIDFLNDMIALISHLIVITCLHFTNLFRL